MDGVILFSSGSRWRLSICSIYDLSLILIGSDMYFSRQGVTLSSSF
jgi:hypothetical protein